MNKKLLTILAVVLPLLLSAQQNIPTNNMGGGHEHVNDPIPDSVPLRITKFSYQSNLFKKSSGIDTTFFMFQKIQGDDNFNNAWMGNLAYPVFYNDFKERLNSQIADFYFLSNFTFLTSTPKDFYYYRTNRPYTKLYYASSLSKETEQQSIELEHSQNIDYYTNFGINYKALLSVEPVRKENSGVNFIRAWIAQDKEKYSWFANIFLNQVKTLHNGGYIDTAGFDPNFAQYYLTKAAAVMVDKGWDLRAQYKVTEKISFSWYSQYNLFYRQYSDYFPKESYYGNIFLNKNVTHDSVSYKKMINQAALKFKDKNLKISVLSGQKLENFYIFRDYIYKQKGFWSSNFYIAANSLYYLNNTLFSSSAKYFLTGRDKGSFDAKLNLNHRVKKLNFNAGASIERAVPDYFMQHYYGNHDKWETNLLPQTIFAASIATEYSPLKMRSELNYYWLENYAYFKNGMPTQLEQKANVLRFSTKGNINLKALNLAYKLTVQKSSAQELNLPLLMANITPYLDFYMFKKAMRMNIGADIYWTSKYNMYAYRPSTDVFYALENRTTGNFPILNTFVNIKVKRVFLFFRMDFVNSSFIDYYQTVEHYHYPDFFMRFGAQWWFKN